jgi:hypothetical protein
MGTVSPHTIVMADNTLFALASVGGKRAFIKIVNRGPKIISDAIDRELQDMGTITDAVSGLCFVGGINYYVTTFPSAKKTWVYDLKEDMWVEWGAWDPSLSRYDVFPIVGTCYAKAWNKHLVLTQDGNVYEMSRETYNDNGDEIRSLIRTGWISHGTGKRKRSNRLYIKIKSYSPTPANVLIRWRDDGRPEWSTFVELPVGSESEQTQFQELTRMGTYRSRQYEFVMTDNADLALCGISEDVEALRT